MKTAIFITLLMQIGFLIRANEEQKVVISEENLIREFIKESPLILENEIQKYSGDLAYRQADDQLQWKYITRANIQEADEIQLAQFEPVTRIAKSIETGVEKNTKYGARLNVSAFSSQSTNPFITNATQTGVRANLAIDLFQDIFGRKTRRNLENASLEKKKTDYMYKMAKVKNINELRKIYWSFVANQESLKLTEKLLKQSLKQVKDSERRLANKITDIGEVSKYRSQVATRRAQINYLSFQKENIIKAIKNYVPQFRDKEISLANYSVDQAVKEVLSCSSTISSYKSSPLENTYYDEIIDLINKKYVNEESVNETYDDIDLKLVGGVEYFGKELNYDGSRDNFSDNTQRRYNLGVALTIPLGSEKQQTADILNKVAKKRYQAQANNLSSKIDSVHYQTINSINVLNEVMKNQKLNTKNLEQSLRISKKKFNQARITTRELVNEQNLALQSYLDEIQTKLSIIHTLLDYLSVYTETPCDLNKGMKL